MQIKTIKIRKYVVGEETYYLALDDIDLPIFKHCFGKKAIRKSKFEAKKHILMLHGIGYKIIEENKDDE